MPSSSVRLLFVFGFATLILIYAAGVQDRDLVHEFVRRLDGPLLGLLLGLKIAAKDKSCSGGTAGGAARI